MKVLVKAFALILLEIVFYIHATKINFMLIKYAITVKIFILIAKNVMKINVLNVYPMHI